MNNFQVFWSNSMFFQFHFLFFPALLRPAEFQASGNESNLLDTTYSLLYLFDICLSKPRVVFGISKVYWNKAKFFFPVLSRSELTQNHTSNQKHFHKWQSIDRSLFHISASQKCTRLFATARSNKIVLYNIARIPWMYDLPLLSTL